MPRRHQRMIENLHREARKGNREACFFMANLYFPGNWTRRNEDQAFEWYLKAAIPKLKEARVY
ncbi:MAG: sel1 repeat family protein [Nitrospinaceae bacterium]|nr:sel1 repeat family protein [Nitrospinaceae bacterium]NIS85235.1 sel1 repeat family protein [Nitrospinaceae bacterium]NIU96439.1 hypothetical protein [Nitrospinaceae bacterium]